VDEKDTTLRPCIDLLCLRATPGGDYLLQARSPQNLPPDLEDHLQHAHQTEYLVMPFDLTNAPAVFQLLMNNVLRDMLNCFVFVSLDNIIVFIKFLEENVHHVQTILQRLLENSLFVKAEKCEFHVATVLFLGYIVAQGSIQIDPVKGICPLGLLAHS